MKRFIGLFAATIAAVVPLSVAGASQSHTPAEYNPGCEQVYQGGKPLFDPLIASPGHPITNAIEKNFCGENKHS